MSRSQKSIGACLAVLVASCVALNLRGIADDAINPSDGKERAKSDLPRDPRNDPPRSHSRPRGSGVPLAHAILKKEEDSKEEKIFRSLDKPTNVEWQELPLEDAITYLAEFHGINIIIEKAALSEAGIALDQPVTLRLQGVRLESALNLLLEPVPLEWVIQDEVMKITTQEWCEDHPEVQVHEIQSLIDAGHTPEELIASIKACIEPTSWSPKDGYAGISHTGGVLVVRQTQRIHTEIARLLADLDDIAEQESEDHPGKNKGAVVSVKVYPTGDQPAEKVAEALQDFVELKSWKNRGGEGEVRPLKGSLVVMQTARVHQAIQRFMSQLESKSQTVAAAPPPAAVPATAAASPDPFRVIPPPAKAGPGTGNPLRRKK